MNPQHQQTLTLVKSHELFEQLSAEDIQSVLAIVEYREYQPEEMVFDTNTQPSYIFLVEKGLFGLELPNGTYKELKEGDVFGEVGFINEDFRSGAVRALETSKVSCISREKLYDKKLISADVALLIVRQLAKRIITYLRSKEQVTTEEIIQTGENDNVEFKSTLRWNLFTNKKDAKMEHAVLKTIAAFMNAQGGILLVGVNDEGEVLGLEKDQFANNDKLLLHLNKLVKDKIGSTFTKNIHASVEKVHGTNLLRIDCRPSVKPAYLKDGNQEYFYIRTGPETTNLRLSKIYAYIRERFYGE